MIHTFTKSCVARALKSPLPWGYLVSQREGFPVAYASATGSVRRCSACAQSTKVYRSRISLFTYTWGWHRVYWLCARCSRLTHDFLQGLKAAARS